MQGWCRAWKVQRRLQSAGFGVRMAAWKVHVGKTAVGLNGKEGRKEGRNIGHSHTRTCHRLDRLTTTST